MAIPGGDGAEPGPGPADLHATAEVWEGGTLQSQSADHGRFWPDGPGNPTEVARGKRYVLGSGRGSQAGHTIPDPRVVAIEVKLTRTVRDEDVRHLLWLHKTLGPDLLAMVVLGTGRFAFRRNHGVAVVPASPLGP